MSGSEYVGLDVAAGSLLHFVPGQPAYAGVLGQAAPGARLSAEATTAWVYVTPASGTVRYFSQPEAAALFGASPAAKFFPFLEVPMGTLAVGGTSPDPVPAFPMAPYGGLARSPSAAKLAAMETQALLPERRTRIPLFFAADSDSNTTGDTGVTPQGISVTLNPARTRWSTVTFAQQDGGPALQLHDVRGPFREALQSAQMFAVLRDPAVVMAAADLDYEMTFDVAEELYHMPDPVPANVAFAAQLLNDQILSYDDFQSGLEDALSLIPGAYALWGDVITRYAARFDLVIAGWRFRLSPTLWGVRADAPTICILKFFTGRSLESLAADPAVWSWTEAAGDPAVAKAAMGDILKAAADAVAASAPAQNDLDYFVHTVMRDPAWNGLLFLHPYVPLEALPDELRGIAGGIDPARMHGHHVGVALTPVGDGAALGTSSLFGLIRYANPDPLLFTGAMYGYQVSGLNVLFANSTLARFSSLLELMLNGFFGQNGSLLDPTRGNNVLLVGTQQLQGSTPSYVFTFEGSNRLALGSPVLREVEVTRARFVTMRNAGTTSSEAAGRFVLGGRLRFNPLPGLDVFSFGPTLGGDGAVVDDGWLTFSNLAIDVVSDGTGAGTLTLAPGDITFDTVSSVARAGSLYAHFPLALAGLLHGTGGIEPGDLGYVAVQTPLANTPLADEWYALAFQLDLGSLGALAAQRAFTVSLAAAWSPVAPDGTGLPVQVGLQLPGGRSLSALVPLQGALGFGFESLALKPAADAGATSYLLQLQRFFVQLLGIDAPPGELDLTFFGNPNDGARNYVGWYAAFSKEG